MSGSQGVSVAAGYRPRRREPASAGRGIAQVRAVAQSQLYRGDFDVCRFMAGISLTVDTWWGFRRLSIHSGNSADCQYMVGIPLTVDTWRRFR